MVFKTIIVKSRPNVHLPTWIMADIVLKTNIPLRSMGSHQSSCCSHEDKFAKERNELDERTRKLDRVEKKLEKKWRKIKESEEQEKIFAERMEELEVERMEIALELRRRYVEMR